MSAALPAEQTQKPKLARRTFVLDRGFQVRYTLLLSLVGAVASGVFGALVLFVERDLRKAAALPPALEAQLASQDTTLLWLIVVLTLLMAAALAVFGLLLTHRVAGPIHVMSHYLSVLSRGRYPVLRPLRRGDELKHFFEGLQNAIESLRQKELQEAALLDKAVLTFAPHAASPELREVLDALRAQSERKRDATDRADAGRAAGGKSAA